MTRRHRSSATRQIGRIIDETLDRAGDVEHHLRRAARKVVEDRKDYEDDRRDERRDDWREGGDTDWDDRRREDIEDILDDLEDLRRRLLHYRDAERGPHRPHGRSRDAGGHGSESGGGQLADQLARLNRRVEELARQMNPDPREGEKRR
ncbi:hypothetical protein AB0J52_22205 [Spirillospora sp. NPDC049652]